MKQAEFEEKEYESPLIAEISVGRGPIWSPGQVLERLVGFDVAVYLDHHFLWSLFHRPFPPPGVILSRRRRLPFNVDPSRLPTFAVNLMLQAKRPQYLSGINSDLSARGIKNAYWRFSITPHQQTVLFDVARSLGSRAVVAYASPAFHTHSDLYSHIENHDIIQHSSFVRAIRLNGHSTWAYDHPGTKGVACSDYETVADEPFLEMLDHALTQETRPQNPSPEQLEMIRKENLLTLTETISKVCKELASDKNPIASEYVTRCKWLRDLHLPLPDNKYVVALLKLSIFSDLTAVEWLVLQ